MDCYAAYLGARDTYLRALRQLFLFRVQIVASSFMSVFLGLLDQSQDLYRAMALDWPSDVSHPLIAVVTLICAGSALWYSGRVMTYLVRPEQTRAMTLEGLIARHGPRVVAVAPIVVVGLGVWWAAGGFEVGEESSLLSDHPLMPEFERARLHLRVSAALLFLLALILYRAFQRRAILFGLERPTRDLPLSTRLVTSTIGIGALLLVAWFVTLPLYGPMHLGAIGIFNLWIMIFTIVGSALAFLATRFKVPILGFLTAMAFLWSLLDFNDNHAIRLLDTTPSRTTLQDAFLRWYASRQDKVPHSFYPVFIVSAQGGGMATAYHAAIVLSRLQDSCPNFAHHVFAISGVSGGSLGAAAFTSLVGQYETRPPTQPCVSIPSTRKGRLEHLADRYLQRDFLAPVIAAMFFPDFLQRFLPFPVYVWDRARALEEGLSAGWIDELGPSTSADNPFDQSLSALWSPQGSVPALILNTTEVETGARLLMTPFPVTLPRSHTFDLSAIDPVHAPALKTAVGASARFTYVLPHGYFWDERGTEWIKRRIVDGGYYENSGSATAEEILRALQQLATDRHLPVLFLPIQIVSPPPHRMRSYALSELLVPAQAMLHTRGARGRDATAHIHGTAPAHPWATSGKDVDLVFELNRGKYGRTYHMPLGWNLSALSRHRIEQQAGFPERCHWESDEISRVDCAAWIIHRVLQIPGGSHAATQEDPQTTTERESGSSESK